MPHQRKNVPLDIRPRRDELVPPIPARCVLAPSPISLAAQLAWWVVGRRKWMARGQRGSSAQVQHESLFAADDDSFQFGFGIEQREQAMQIVDRGDDAAIDLDQQVART